MSGFRLADGGRIDRGSPQQFKFEGRSYNGFAGDTLASAVIANGVTLVGRSFKYHRPRGILTSGSEEPNALVELRTGARREPNTRATTIELYDGLEAASQNRWPSLGFDLLSATAPLAPFMSAGFYYKTFMWPAAFWEKVYEPLIRRAAGLGRAAEGEDPDRYEKAYAFCDLLIIGAGPAGLSAALAAGRAGARVIVCNEDFEFGGRLLSERQTIDDQPAQHWLEQTLAELASLPDVTFDAAHHCVRRLRSRHVRRDRACVGSSACSATASAASARMAHCREAIAAVRGCDRAAAGVRWQRSSRRDDG